MRDPNFAHKEIGITKGWWAGDDFARDYGRRWGEPLSDQDGGRLSREHTNGGNVRHADAVTKATLASWPMHVLPSLAPTNQRRKRKWPKQISWQKVEEKEESMVSSWCSCVTNCDGHGRWRYTTTTKTVCRCGQNRFVEAAALPTLSMCF